MRELAAAHRITTASPAAFYERWLDHETWGEWSPDTAWVRLDGPVRLGQSGTLKPTGGPRVRFVVSALDPDRRYADTSRLPGARLAFDHVVDVTAAGTLATARVTLTGPLSALWARILGPGFRSSVPADLDRLVALLEPARASVEGA